MVGVLRELTAINSTDVQRQQRIAHTVRESAQRLPGDCWFRQAATRARAGPRTPL